MIQSQFIPNKEMIMILENDVAIVTGGASGIGRAIAIRFAKEGARVVVADLQLDSQCDDEKPDTVAAIKKANGEASFIKTDVSSSKEVNALVEDTVKKYGKVSILANVAGIFIRNAIADVSDQEWDKVLKINLNGYFYTMRAVIPHMLKQGEGRIVNVSSIHGIRGTGTAATYCASKGGIEQLTRQVAIDYAKNNIRVNSVAPGTTRTHMCQPYLDTPSIRAEYDRRTLTSPRLGIPEDTAAAALFMVAPENVFVMGTSLVVDGGWTIT
jgi:glucose 1-dehydrogenase